MNKIARIVNGTIVYSDTHAPVTQASLTAANESRNDQRVRFRKEMLQPNDLNYYRAYPEQAKNLSDGLRRRAS